MNGAGKTRPRLRRDVERYLRGGEPASLDPKVVRLVDQVRDSPASADLEALLEAGWSEDEVLEIVFVVACTEGQLRLERGRAAMGEP